ITISKNGLLVKLNVDSTDMQVNNNFINLDVPPEVREGRTFVPLRAVAEAFGAEVNYFGYEQKVEIKYQDIILEMWIGRNEARKIKRL
ncbi:MAG: copper amine oxidase N-terminal domain-containing protein, partial [Epsilonproteobacteria bacterium]|nr:copper amine oxidase N-terminal domain-containing protein [Campylobacterota bacterium]